MDSPFPVFMRCYYQITALIVRAFTGMGKRIPPLRGGVLQISLRDSEMIIGMSTTHSRNSPLLSKMASSSPALLLQRHHDFKLNLECLAFAADPLWKWGISPIDISPTGHNNPLTHQEQRPEESP